LTQGRKLPKIGKIKLDPSTGYNGNFDNHPIHGQFKKNQEIGHSLEKKKKKKKSENSYALRTSWRKFIKTLSMGTPQNLHEKN
jgi:hypothetical protein